MGMNRTPDPEDYRPPVLRVPVYPQDADQFGTLSARLASYTVLLGRVLATDNRTQLSRKLTRALMEDLRQDTSTAVRLEAEAGDFPVVDNPIPFSSARKAWRQENSQ